MRRQAKYAQSLEFLDRAARSTCGAPTNGYDVGSRIKKEIQKTIDDLASVDCAILTLVHSKSL